MRRTFILPVFVILSLLALPHLAQTLDTEGLVLYLPFDEGQGEDTADLSGNGNDGTLENGAEWVDGYFGKGVYLAEIPDHVEVPDSPTLDIEESLTLAIWANIEGLPDGSCALFMKATSYMLHTTTGGDGVKIDPLVFIGGNYGTWPTPVVVSGTMGEWHHYAATYDGTKYDLFVDGVLIDSYDRISGGSIDQDDNPLYIGRDNRAGCDQRNSPCTIDEAVVFSRALSESEMAEVMIGGFTAVEANDKLATCWSMIKSQ
jgi:hypothetical protein